MSDEEDPVDTQDDDLTEETVGDQAPDDGDTLDDPVGDAIAADSDDSGLDDVAPDTQTSSEDAEILAGYGLDKYRSIDDALKGAAEAQRLIGERNEMAEFGRQIAPHYQQFQQYLQAQQQAEQYQPEPAWAPPHKYDEEMQRLEAFARAGEEGWGQLSQEQQEKVSGYLEYRNQWWNSVFNNPQKLLEDVFRPGVEQIIGQALQHRDMQHQAQAFVQQSKDLITNPITYRELDELLARGVPSDVAQELVRARQALAGVEGARQKVESEKGSLENQKRQLRRRASRRGQVSGKPNMEFDVDKMNYDEIQRAVLQAEEAGALG